MLRWGLPVPLRRTSSWQGVYTYTPEQGDERQYQIWPSCVPVVGDLREPLDLPVACRLHMVAPSAGLTGGDARLTGGVWQWTTLNTEGHAVPRRQLGIHRGDDEVR